MATISSQIQNQWYVAATSEALGRSAPLARVVLDQPLVLFRDAQGRARCATDRCLHRNAQLSQGVVIDGCLACPYHGWTYDGVGACVHVPSDGPGTRPRVERTLRTWPVRELDGLVWVWLGSNETPESERPEPYRMPHVATAGFRRYIMVTEFENDVTACAENFIDVPHTIYVHAGWFRSQRRRAIHAVIERSRTDVLVTYNDPDDSIGYSHLILNPRREPVTHTDRFIMPNITHVDYRFGPENGFSIVSTCSPVSEFRTLVYTSISYRLGVFTDLARFFLPAYTRKVIEQDVVILRNQGVSLKRFGRQFAGTDVDLMHEWIGALRFAAERDEPPPEPEPPRAEVTFHV